MLLQTLVPTVSLKNELSQDTHLPCRVPKWSLYITHGVPTLCLVPVSSNEARPHAQAGRVPTWSLYNTRWVADSCTHSLPNKRVFPGYPPTLQGIHMAPLQHPWVPHPCLAPATKPCRMPQKHIFLVPPGHICPRSP